MLRIITSTSTSQYLLVEAAKDYLEKWVAQLYVCIVVLVISNLDAYRIWARRLKYILMDFNDGQMTDMEEAT